MHWNITLNHWEKHEEMQILWDITSVTGVWQDIGNLAKYSTSEAYAEVSIDRQSTQKGRHVHEVQQSDKENWQTLDDEMDKNINMIARSFSLNSIR